MREAVTSLGGAAVISESASLESVSKMSPVHLGAEDAKDWAYKGEGAANLVLSYCGSSPFLAGKVLRVPKILKGRRPQRGELLSQHEQLLWSDTGELVDSASKEISEQAFVAWMAPLLGSEFIDAGKRVSVAREFLESIEKNIIDQRPAWRVDASEVDTLSDSALLIPDHSVFLSGRLKEDISFAVEIKPKCGFLPSSEYIAKRNAVKKHVTRFRMHQLLKLKQGEISQTSDYNPLDLFSGSKERIYEAIMALFATPQNNFRVFLNGALIFGGLGGGMDGSVQSHGSRDTIEDVIRATGLCLASFCELITEAILQSGILDRLIAAQKLDSLDIEGAIHTFYNIISQPCMVCGSLPDAELLNQYAYLHSLSLKESLDIVREYLIATTAKDCSIMISFRPQKGRDAISVHNSVLLESSNESFDYKACFIDLDRKSLKKMAYYYELDQKIVSLYSDYENIMKIPCNSTLEASETCIFSN